MLTADTTRAKDSRLADTGESKTPPHVRLRKSAHDTILAHPVPRMRTPMLAVQVALLRAENDSRALHGEDFTVSVAEVARLAGMSVRSMHRFLPALVEAGLLAKPASGRNSHTENTYRLLSPDGPPRRALASAPATLAEVDAYVLSMGWDVLAGTSREFFAHNDARQWMIPDATGKRFNHCRDWRKLLAGWIETHRPAPPAQPPPPNPAGPSAATPPRRTTMRKPPQSILITTMGEPLGSRAEVLCNIMRRDPRVPWRHEEFEALRCTGIAPSPEFQFNEDTDALAWYYSRFEKGYWINNERVDYRRQSMLALLLNWADEIMKAKRAFHSSLDEKRRSDAGRLYSTNEPEVTIPAYPSAPS